MVAVIVEVVEIVSGTAVVEVVIVVVVIERVTDTTVAVVIVVVVEIVGVNPVKSSFFKYIRGRQVKVISTTFTLKGYIIARVLQPDKGL